MTVREQSRIDGARLLADLRALARFGQVGTGVDRRTYSPADVQARHWLRDRMREAGLAARIDGIGNVFGRSPGTNRAILVGSHTDTVPRGGWLDGAMGVLFGLEIARSRLERGGTGVDVVSFADEEGTYHSLLGSRAFCGVVDPDGLLETPNAEGRTLGEALASAGFAGPVERIDRQRHFAYLEAHIEQGPRLEAAGARIGVVSAIVGIRRCRITVAGRADHAGTTPMAMRRDAGAAVIEIAHALLEGFPRHGSPRSVWNLGRIAFEPGAANVVPALATLIVEFRDPDPAVVAELGRFVDAIAAGVGTTSALPTRVERLAEDEGTALDARLGDVLAAAAAAQGEQALRMVSGAGHDAMVVGRVVPAAMLFIPSIGGRSHDVAENSTDADIVLGCEVLAVAIDRLLATA
jgi:N-carbamoyl-L-amino-acid hydrolase